MLRKIIRGIFTIIGLLIGYIAGKAILKLDLFEKMSFAKTSIGSVLFIVIISLIFGVILYGVSPKIYQLISNLIEIIETNMKKFSATEILFGAIGAIIPLIIVFFLASPLNDFLSPIGPMLFILINILAAVIGMKITIDKKDDIMALIVNVKKNSAIKEKVAKDKKNKKESENLHKEIPKVLDTSVIIDGRIFDICETGFVEGPLVIPNFVLDELRHIADSSDSLKRVRGRRGLDILNKIQKELDIETRIYEGDFPKIAEVDAKLLKLAQVLNGKVVTNDYNLNKVAEVQGVPVLNINELSNAIKPVVIPGEEMVVEIVKLGKENSQGVAYLDDGTMIVVEGGKKHLNETIDVIVTSVLQTAAGRMIFARPKDN